MPSPRTYYELRRRWKPGDTIELELPVEPRLIESHPRAEETRNQVTVALGPLIYCQPDFTRRSNPLQFEGLTGPAPWSLDMTLAKTFKVTERIGFEVRMETYNLTNSFIGAMPNVNVDNSQFGRAVTQRAGFNGRQFQYTGRFRW